MTRALHRSIAAILLGLCVAIALPAHPLHAQQPSILVVRAQRVPPSLQRDIAGLLSSLGESISDTDYVKASRRMRLSPHDPQAIVALLPGLGIGLVVTIETTTHDAGRYLRLSYRSPETGDEVVKDELPYRGGPLPSSYRNWVLSQARLALATLAARARQAPAARSDPNAAARAWRNHTRTQRPPPAPELGESPPEFGDDSTAQAPADAATAHAAALSDNEAFVEDDDTDHEKDADLAPRVLQMDGLVGLGLGQRAVTLPTQSGPRLLDVGPFLMMDGAVRARVRLADSAQVLLALRYSTSVALQAESTPAAGVPQSVPLRSQRFEVVLGAVGRIGTGATEPWLGVQLGYAVQDLHGLIEITMPRYSIGGPFARVDLRAVVAEGRVTLWAMPEGQWLVGVDNSLTRLHVAHSGFAIGGELGIGVRLSSQFLWETSYRESHSFLSTLQSDAFHDLERAFTTRLVVQR